MSNENTTTDTGFEVREDGGIYVTGVEFEDHTGYVGQVSRTGDDHNLKVVVCDDFLEFVLRNNICPVTFTETWQNFRQTLRNFGGGVVGTVFWFAAQYGNETYIKQSDWDR